MNQGSVLDRSKPLTDVGSGKHSREEIVEEFFAVTIVSVYRVSSKRDSEGTPIVEKIAEISEGSIPVGGRLRGGNLVGVMKSKIVLYIEDYSPFSGPMKRRQRPEEVNIAYWGWYSAPIAALCLKKDEALMYLRLKELKNCDPRCRKETEETLERISDNHPVFVLSRTEPIKFD